MILISMDCFCQVNINPDPNGPPWISGGVPFITPAIQQQIDAIPKMQRQSFIDPPELVDNSQWEFMPQIFLQEGNCCSQASGIAYVFTYEINWLRGFAANDEDNQYPTHFTYNFLNSGDPDNGSWIFDGWEILEQNGCPNISTYGSMDANGNATFWMTGFDNYYAASLNRVDYYENIDLSDPMAGLTVMKQWLFNHNDDDKEVGGLASFTTNMLACDIQIIQPPLPESGKTFLNEYDNPGGMNHQLTIVGYDDNIYCPSYRKL